MREECACDILRGVKAGVKRPLGKRNGESLKEVRYDGPRVPKRSR